LHEIHKKEQMEEDQRLQREYALKLQREQEAREAAFKARMDILDHFFEKSKEEGAGKLEREEQIRTELLLLKNQTEKEARDALNEKLKEDARVARIRFFYIFDFSIFIF
jgi:hypothetical protein